MPIPKQITVQWLRRVNACGAGVRRFSRRYPDGAKLTKAGLIKFSRDGMGHSYLHWLLYVLAREADISAKWSNWVRDARTRGIFDTYQPKKVIEAFWKLTHPKKRKPK